MRASSGRGPSRHELGATIHVLRDRTSPFETNTARVCTRAVKVFRWTNRKVVRRAYRRRSALRTPTSRRQLPGERLAASHELHNNRTDSHNYLLAPESRSSSSGPPMSKSEVTSRSLSNPARTRPRRRAESRNRPTMGLDRPSLSTPRPADDRMPRSGMATPRGDRALHALPGHGPRPIRLHRTGTAPGMIRGEPRFDREGIDLAVR